MRVWIYGDSFEQIRALSDRIVRCGGVVAGCSIRKTGRCAFPHSGLTPAGIRCSYRSDTGNTGRPCGCGADFRDTQELWHFDQISL